MCLSANYVTYTLPGEATFIAVHPPVRMCAHKNQVRFRGKGCSTSDGATTVADVTLENCDVVAGKDISN